MTNTSRTCSTPILLKTSLFLAAIAITLSSSSALAQDAIAAPPVFTADTASFRPITAPVLFAALTPEAPAFAASDSSAEALPDAPSQVLRSSNVGFDAQMHPASAHIAPLSLKYIPAGWTAQPLTAHDKVVLAFKDSYSPFSFLGIIASAGYSHLVNGQPNYGTDKGAFGQRLGATAIRDTSEQLLTDAVFAPLLHEDPRYYVEGSQYNFFHRVFYAATRPIITRTDGGHTSPNVALLLGYGAASAISYSYYPAINQNAKDIVATFGGALGGAAIGDLVSEFSDEFLVKLHLKKAL
jgi:hypothetical protein